MTCLAVLTLFPAFPELDRVPAQNKGGKVLATTNTASPIEVSNVAGCFDICAVTIEEKQIRLRALLPLYVFSTDVQLLSTKLMLKRRAASQTKFSSAVAREALL
jgi:hypothetical protein